MGIAEEENSKLGNAMALEYESIPGPGLKTPQNVNVPHQSRSL